MSPIEKSYGVRVLEAIRLQCERRGIPPEEMESVLAHIADERGASVLEMDASDLKRVQANLDALLRRYLDGSKRRHGPAGPWEVNATHSAIVHAAIHGLDLAEIEGTGQDGQITKADVESHIAEAS